MSKIEMGKEQLAEFVVQAVNVGKPELAKELIIEAMDSAYQAGSDNSIKSKTRHEAIDIMIDWCEIHSIKAGEL